MNKKGLIKVKSALMMKPEYVKVRHPDASFTPSSEFNEMIIDSDERFRSAVITFINDAVSNEWAVIFTPFVKDIFDARIYCEIEDYDTIVNIIKERLSDVRFHQYYLEGTVNDIDNQW